VNRIEDRGARKVRRHRGGQAKGSGNVRSPEWEGKRTDAVEIVITKAGEGEEDGGHHRAADNLGPPKLA